MLIKAKELEKKSILSGFQLVSFLHCLQDSQDNGVLCYVLSRHMPAPQLQFSQSSAPQGRTRVLLLEVCAAKQGSLTWGLWWERCPVSSPHQESWEPLHVLTEAAPAGRVDPLHAHRTALLTDTAEAVPCLFPVFVPAHVLARSRSPSGFLSSSWHKRSCWVVFPTLRARRQVLLLMDKILTLELFVSREWELQRMFVACIS